MEAKVKKYHTDNTKIYKLIKLHPDGKQELKGIGEVYYGGIELGKGAIVANWFTTIVEDIIVTGKGCIFETLNSTYLLEVFDKIPDDDAA